MGEAADSSAKEASLTAWNYRCDSLGFGDNCVAGGPIIDHSRFEGRRAGSCAASAAVPPLRSGAQLRADVAVVGALNVDAGGAGHTVSAVQPVDAARP